MQQVITKEVQFIQLAADFYESCAEKEYFHRYRWWKRLLLPTVEVAKEARIAVCDATELELDFHAMLYKAENILALKNPSVAKATDQINLVYTV